MAFNINIPPAKIPPPVRKPPKKKRKHPGSKNGPKGLRHGLRVGPPKVQVVVKAKTKKAKPPRMVKNRRETMYLAAPWCHWCMDSLSFTNMTIDHVIPLARGGTNARRNLVVCCKECNNKKGSWMPSDWLPNRMDADELKWWAKVESEMVWHLRMHGKR